MLDTQICHTQWDTFNKSLTIQDTNAVPINITESTFVFSVKKEVSDTAFVIQSTGIITLPLTGKVDFSISASTMNIADGNYFYDIQWTASGGEVRTILRGSLKISYQIT